MKIRKLTAWVLTLSMLSGSNVLPVLAAGNVSPASASNAARESLLPQTAVPSATASNALSASEIGKSLTELFASYDTPVTFVQDTEGTSPAASLNTLLGNPVLETGSAASASTQGLIPGSTRDPEWYYSLLDEDQQLYYRLLDTYYEAALSGDIVDEKGDPAQTLTLSLPDIMASFTTEEYTEEYVAWLSAYIPVYQGMLTYNMNSAMTSYLYDNPELFWNLSYQYESKILTNGDKYDIYYVIHFSMEESCETLQEMDEQLTAAVNGLQIRASDTASRVEQIHDALAEICAYKTTGSSEYTASAYGALVDGGANSQGYAKAFKLICDRYDIPSVLVYGNRQETEGTYIWNSVQMEDSLWYGVDVCMDDDGTDPDRKALLAGSATELLTEDGTSYGDLHKEVPLEITADNWDGLFVMEYPEIEETSYDAHDSISDWTFTWEAYEDGTVGILTASGSTPTMIVPAEIEGQTVSAFLASVSETETLERVWFADTIPVIGDEAFTDCYNLHYVRLPKELKSLGRKAFAGTDLTSVVIPAGLEEVALTGDELGNYGPFTDCYALSEIGFAEGCETIPDYLFYGCTGFTELTLPASVREIGSGAFANTNLINLNFEEGLERIGAGAFSGIPFLMRVSLPDSLKEIGDGAFYGDKWLNVLELGSGLESIGAEAFANCSKLYRITALVCQPGIGENAFDGVTATVWYGTENFLWASALKSKAYGGETSYEQRSYGGSLTWSLQDDLLSAVSVSMALDQDLSLNLYVTPLWVNDNNGAEITTATVQVEGEEALELTGEEEEDGTICYTVHLAAAEMTREVTFDLSGLHSWVYEGSNYSDEAATSCTLSIRDYLETLAEKCSAEESYSGMSEVVAAIASYGAAAQNWFAVKTDDPADSFLEAYGLTITDTQLADFMEDYLGENQESQEEESEIASGIRLLGESLLLDSVLGMKCYLQFAEDPDAGSFYGKYGEEKLELCQESEGAYSLCCTPILLPEIMDRTWISLLQDDGEETVIGELELQPMAYICKAYQSEDAALRRLTALLAYQSHIINRYAPK